MNGQQFNPWSVWAQSPNNSFCSLLLVHQTNPTTTSTTYHQPVFRKSSISNFWGPFTTHLWSCDWKMLNILIIIVLLFWISNYIRALTKRLYQCKGYTMLGTATMKNSMEIPQKIKNRTAIWCSNLTSEYISKKRKTGFQKDIGTPLFIVALFTIAKIWKVSKTTYS